MQSNQRKIGVLLNYVSEVVKVITTLAYTPLMLRLLGQSEYGLYQLVNSTVSYLGLLSFGFGSAYVRYHSRYQVKGDAAGISRLNGMFLVVFSAMAVLCLICGGVMTVNAQLVFGDGLTASELEKAKLLLSILVVSMALTFPRSVFTCYVTAHEQFLFQKVLQLAQSILNPFLTLPLLLMGYGSVAMVLISAVLTVAALAADIYFCKKRLRMQFAFKNLDFSLLKEMWVFTFYIFLTEIIDQVNWSVDKFLLGRMIGTASVAVYGIGGQINSLYIQLSTAVASVFAPKINQIVAESDDNAELTRIMIKVGRIQFLVIALVASGFIFYGQPFVRLWAGKGYEQAYAVALLLMLSMMVPLIQNIGIEILRAKNMHRTRSVVYTCLAAGNILLSVFLIKRWGCVGAAAGTAIALILGNVLFMNWYYYNRVGLHMRLFWKEILGFAPALILISLFGIIYGYWVTIQNWGQFLIAVFLYTAVYCVVMLCMGCNTYEKQLVRSLLRKLMVPKKENT